MNRNVNKFDPAVDRRILIFLSGAAWSVVGAALCRLALGWLINLGSASAPFYGLGGVTLSLAIHHFGFLKIVDSNISRIMTMKKKVCIFAFQAWKSYLIIAVMIGIGIVLRHSPLPKQYLSVIYIGFGGAMVLSSIRYFTTFLTLIRTGGNP